MSSSNDFIFQAAQALRLDLVGFLRDLIAIPSTSGNEAEVVRRIQQEMVKIGYDDVWIDPMGNLIGRLGSGDKIIAIDGHCDTVDIGDIANWNVDPYKGAHQDGVIYGRGASDQKGGIASAVYAASIIKQVGLSRNTCIYVVASILEENFEGLAWRYIIEHDKIVPRLVVLTEPTDMKIAIGHRGRLEMKIKVRGASCHGSTPERGENAVYMIAPIVRSVEKLNMKLSGDSILGDGSVAVTDICAKGPSLCAIPDSAMIHLDRRLTMGETQKSAMLEIKGLPGVRKSGAEVIVPEYQVQSYGGVKERVEAYFPAWLMDRSDDWLQKAQNVYHGLFGKSPEISIWKFSTHGVATRGLHNIATFGFGPGKEVHAHTPNDQINEQDLIDAMAYYACFALEN